MSVTENLKATLPVAPPTGKAVEAAGKAVEEAGKAAEFNRVTQMLPNPTGAMKEALKTGVTALPVLAGMGVVAWGLSKVFKGLKESVGF